MYVLMRVPLGRPVCVCVCEQLCISVCNALCRLVSVEVLGNITNVTYCDEIQSHLMRGEVIRPDPMYNVMYLYW